MVEREGWYEILPSVYYIKVEGGEIRLESNENGDDVCLELMLTSPR